MPSNNDQWIAFDNNILEQAIKDQKIIIVNITADWCTTCKINEMTIFNDKFIQTNSNIILMKGDFTNYSDELKKYIDKYNSPGIPLTVIYGPNHPNGIAMSTILNEQEITETLAKLS
jgi:suppressor for copper-sensitivity B